MIATDPSINFWTRLYSLPAILVFSKFHLSWLQKTRIFIRYLLSIVFIEFVAPIFHSLSLPPLSFIHITKGASSSLLAKWYMVFSLCLFFCILHWKLIGYAIVVAVLWIILKTKHSILLLNANIFFFFFFYRNIYYHQLHVLFVYNTFWILHISWIRKVLSY